MQGLYSNFEIGGEGGGLISDLIFVGGGGGAEDRHFSY